MTSTLRDVIDWCLGAAFVITAGAAVLATRRARRIAAAQIIELNEARGRLQAREDEFGRAIADATEVGEENTKIVLKSAARTIQSLAYEEQNVIDDLQRKYGGHPVLTDLLAINFTNAQISRRAESIAVLCGGSLGRRKDPASIYDVVRSAQGKIRSFERVEIAYESPFVIQAHAINAISLALAELLDNAARHSDPTKPIKVSFLSAPNALCIVVDDAGVGMTDEQKRAFSALLSGQYTPTMSQLGPRPQFGFPVVARLARQYGFSVDVSTPSPFLGVRAVMALPPDLWTEEPIDPKPVPEPTPTTPIRSVPAPVTLEPVGTTAHGLPKRGARQQPVVSGPRAVDATVVPSGEDSVTAGRRLGGLQRGTLSGRRSVQAPHEGFESQ